MSNIGKRSKRKRVVLINNNRYLDDQHNTQNKNLVVIDDSLVKNIDLSLLSEKFTIKLRSWGENYCLG